MSLKRPSYFLRMVFLVLRYSGQPLTRAIWKELCAKSRMDLSVLYMPMATPPVPRGTRKNTGAASWHEVAAADVGHRAGGSLTESFELGVKPVKSQWEQKEKGKSGSVTVVTVCIIAATRCFNALQCWERPLLNLIFHTVRPLVLLHDILWTLSCTNYGFCLFQCFYFFLSIKVTGSGIHRDLKNLLKTLCWKFWLDVDVFFFSSDTMWQSVSKQKSFLIFSCFFFPIQDFVETLNRPNKWADWRGKGLFIYLLANPVMRA